jgi:hypothetical protein
MSTCQHVRRHYQWRRTLLSRATVNGAAKKGYSCEIFSLMVHFVKLFQVWVIFV